MRRRVLASSIVLGGLVVACAGVGWAAWAGWHVEKRSPGEISELLRPHDEVLVPEGPGPFPAVVMFHGGRGKSASFRADWATFFRDLGFLTVVVDSFAGRGLDWHAVVSGRSLWGAERAGDVWVTLADVRSRPDVDPERIVLAGWSHGAWSIMDLLALHAAGSLPPSLSSAPDGSLRGLAGVVLFYPWCSFPARSGATPWRMGVPALMLLAGSDRLASPGACLDVANLLVEAGQPVAVELYPGVDHAFDTSVLPEGSDLRFAPEAAADAHRAVRAFLRPFSKQAVR